MRTTGCLLAVVTTLFAAAFCGGPSPVRLECETFRYTIGADGVNTGFVDKATDTDYLDRTRPSPCARVTVGNSISNVTAASFRRGLLTLDFGGSGVKATVRTVARRRHITFEVVSVEGGAVSSLEFLNIPPNPQRPARRAVRRLFVRPEHIHPHRAMARPPVASLGGRP